MLAAKNTMFLAPANFIDIQPLNLSTLRLNAEQFQAICAANPDLPLELTSAGNLVIMSPVGGESGGREWKLGGQLFVWNEATQLGEAFSSSTIFRLPGGSQRSPDLSWVENSRWAALALEDRKKFPPIAPDFIIELRSESDNMAELQAKMREYQDNGVRLGWLLDPKSQVVEIYRLGRSVEVLQSPTVLDGEDVLPGFTLELSRIW
jgi:Uma2 family endonuclease